MPFKSKSQQRFMFAAAGRGEIPKKTVMEFAHATKNIKNLPEQKSSRDKAYKKAMSK